MENMEVPSNGRSRERMLAEHELKALVEVTATSTTFHAIVRLLILTGARRGEIAALEWSWIDDQERTITLPSTITKNRRSHTFPYGDLTAAVFAAIPRIDRSPYVFPAARQRTEKTTTFNGWGKPKAALDAQINLAPWTLHDLRRTYSSTMAALGVPQIVVEKLLNHVSGGTQSPIAQTYNRYSYLPEMRDAILKYEAYLAKLVSPGA